MGKDTWSVHSDIENDFLQYYISLFIFILVCTLFDWHPNFFKYKKYVTLCLKSFFRFIVYYKTLEFDVDYEHRTPFFSLKVM